MVGRFFQEQAVHNRLVVGSTPAGLAWKCFNERIFSFQVKFRHRINESQDEHSILAFFIN
jgi:hypothetical protein